MKRAECSTINPSAHERLILDHMPIVRAVASRIRAGLPAAVDLDDLVQMGVLGLIDAASKYDPARSNEFRTYAKHRIRGAILDSLRRLDMAPRELRRRQRKVEAVTQHLTAELRRHPDETEVAGALGVNLESLRKTKASVDGLNFISVSPGAVEAEGTTMTFELSARPGSRPDETSARRELESVLDRTIRRLPPRQQEVVRLYYNEELTMKEIGSSLSVNESRVSQIHSQAIANLGKILAQEGIDSVHSFAA